MVQYVLYENVNPGLKIMAGQWTMFSQDVTIWGIQMRRSCSVAF